MPTLELAYGAGTVWIDLPEHAEPDVVCYHMSTPARAQSSIESALLHPIASPRLRELAVGRQRAVILISDMTRLCPSYLFLPLLLNELNEGGIPDERITVMVALGMHRKQSPQELKQLAGEETYRRVAVMNHSAMDEDCIHVGITTQGTPVAIHRTVVDADLRIATGNIEPHRLVGISGGVKALVPGVAAHHTIEKHHALSHQFKAQPGDSNNPLHQDLEEAVKFVPIHFLFNVVVDHQRRIIEAAAGDVISAHRHLMKSAQAHFLVPIHKKYDLVLASAGGHPKDIQLYQAVKSIQNASSICKPGGTILLLASCEEMYGNGLFQYWVETMNWTKMLEKLKEKFVLGPHKVEHIDQILKKHKVCLFSELPDAVCGAIGIHPVHELDVYIAELMKDRCLDVAIMPYASITFPIQASS